MNLGILIERMQELPQKVRNALLKCLRFAEKSEGTPSGSVLVAVYLLEFLGIPKHIDEIFAQENTPICELKKEYKSNLKKAMSPPMPSPGLIIALLIADMVACPKNLIRISNVEKMAERWNTGPLLGIAPFLLNDDRLLRMLSILGKDVSTLVETLHLIVVHVATKFEIPLNRFFVDTTVLQLDGQFGNAKKVTPGRGKDSFSQLVVGLTIAAGSRLPINFGVNPGNTFDAHTLPSAIESINRVAEPGAVEVFMDRIFATPENVHTLHQYQEKREIYWTSPLKTGLAGEKFRKLVAEIWDTQGWLPIKYRSAQEIHNKIESPMTAYETTWTVTYELKPEKIEGKRRPKGSIQRFKYPVRLVVYRHAGRAEKEKQARLEKRKQLEQLLQGFQKKLNKRNLITIESCQESLKKLLNGFHTVKSFVRV